MAQTDHPPIDLNFDGRITLYATHGLRAFAAKWPARQAKCVITKYPDSEKTILDPMDGNSAGSLEVGLLGRSVIPLDLNSLIYVLRIILMQKGIRIRAKRIRKNLSTVKLTIAHLKDPMIGKGL